MTLTTLGVVVVITVAAAFALGLWVGREREADAWAYRAVCNTAMYRDGEFYSVAFESEAIKHRLAYAREQAERAEFDKTIGSLLTDVIVDKYAAPTPRHFRVDFPTRGFTGMFTDAEGMAREFVNGVRLASDTVKLTPLSDDDYKLLGFDLAPSRHAITHDSNGLKVVDEQP